MWSSAGRRGRSWASLVVAEDEVEVQASWPWGCEVEVILFDGSLDETVGFDKALSGKIGADMMSVGVMKCDVFFCSGECSGFGTFRVRRNANGFLGQGEFIWT